MTVQNLQIFKMGSAFSIVKNGTLLGRYWGRYWDAIGTLLGRY